MPDVLTHLLIGGAIALLVCRDGPRSEKMLIMLGAVLIDIERPFTWLLSIMSLDWIDLSSAFHSILGAIVLSYFAGACFIIDGISFKKSVMLVFIGCLSHLVLDMMMYPWTELGIPLLYPLRFSFSFHLLWPDFWFYPVFGCVVLMFVLCIRYFGRLHSRTRTAIQKSQVNVGDGTKS